MGVQLWNSALGSGGCPRQAVSTLPQLSLTQANSAWPHGRRRSSPTPSPQPDKPKDTCGGPWKFGTPVEVYHIVPANATPGVSEKNAADARGDLDFIFGGLLRASGVKQYYDTGFVEVVHVSVDEWGPYMKCNHAADSTEYTCSSGGIFSRNRTETTLAGRESNPESRDSEPGWWYSFPAAGENIHWEQVNDGNCSTVRVTAKCVIDMIADAAGCSCTSAEATSCGKCVEGKLSVDQRVQLWNSALGSGGCPRQGASSIIV